MHSEDLEFKLILLFLELQPKLLLEDLESKQILMHKKILNKLH